MALLAIFLALINIAYSTPTVTFPINSQVPPIAKASEKFKFVFSDSTFTSSEPTISYSLLLPPRWLRLDGPTRTLSGTPAASDVGASTFGLTAIDGSGSVNMGVTLIVTKDVGITLGAPILPQLEQFGPTSSPETLFLHPSDPFSFSLSPNTFVGTSKMTSFYAISADGSPLPSWINFDSRSLHFSGLTPPILSPRATPEPFGIKLIASDYPGFSGAVAPFQIIVSSHVLAFNTSFVGFTISKGGDFTSPPLRDMLFLDGKPAETGQFVQIGGSLPDWLSLDRNTLTLSGTPPDETSNENVTIPVIDLHGDIANITLSLTIQNILLNDGESGATATIGRNFNYTFEKSILNGSSVRLDVDLGAASTWLTYNDESMELSGLVPRTLAPQNLTLNLVATKDKISETEPFTLSLVRGAGPFPPSMTGASQTSSSPSASSRSIDKTSGSGLSSKRRNLIIIASTVAPVVGLILIILLMVFCQRRRKRHCRSISEQEISRPQPLMTEVSDTGENDPTFRSGRTDFQHLQTPPRVPTIDLGKTWTSDTLRRSRLRASRLPNDEEMLGQQDASFMAPHAVAGDSPQPVFKRQPRDLTPFRRDNTNYSRKRAPFRSIQSRDLDASPVKKREPRVLSRASSRLSGPVVSKRISGFGHGAGGLGPPGYGNVRRSWRDTKSSFTMPSDEGKERSVDSMIWSFPQPPRNEQFETSGANPDPQKRTSIRLVSDPSFSRLSHASQFPDYIRQRAQSRQRGDPRSNPLFSAGAVGGSERPSRSPVFEEIDWNEMGNPKRLLQRSYSQSSSIGPPLRPVKKSSRRNIGVRVSEGFSKLAHFRSEMSLSSNGRFDSAESDDLSDEYADIVEGVDSDGQHRWFRGTDRPTAQDLERSRKGRWEEGSVPETKIQGLHPSAMGPSRPQRFSPLAVHPRDGSAFGEPSDEQRLKLFDERGKRPVSVDEGGLKHPIIGSQKGDIAFL